MSQVLLKFKFDFTLCTTLYMEAQFNALHCGIIPHIVFWINPVH